MCHIGILPALVEDTAVIHHHRAPVAVLVKGELSCLSRLRVVKEQPRHFISPVGARQTKESSRCAEDYPPVGSISRLKAVKILVRYRCYLPDHPGGRFELEYVPPVVCPDRGEEHLLTAEVHLRIGNDHPVRRFIDGSFGTLSLFNGEGNKHIVPSRCRVP